MSGGRTGLPRSALIIRRIGRHIARQDWTAIAIEFAIVTAGVLMGLQVSNWNDDRIDRASLHRQLVSLRAELVYNRSLIEDYRTVVASQLSDIRRVKAVLQTPSPASADFDAQLMNIWRVRSLLLDMSAYRAVVDGGGARRLEPDLREALSAWDNERARLARSDGDALAYRAAVTDSALRTLDFGGMVHSMNDDFPTTREGAWRNDPARLSSDPVTRNYVAMRYGIEAQKLEFAARLDAETRRLIALLPSA